MIALSFLGTGNYRETTYVLGERKHTSDFFTAVLPAFFDVDRLLVAMTEEAQSKHGEALARQCTYEPVPIPSGKNEGELWKLFDALAQAVPKESSLILDVTHGFRSQPILALAAAVYLQSAKNVRLEGIFYGAFEARDPATGETPVFDLTPFQQLIEWASASRFFLQAGDAVALSRLLKESHTRTHRDKQREYRAHGLRQLGNALENITSALALVQPLTALACAEKLPAKLEAVREDLRHIPEIRPFAFLIDGIERSFKPLIDAHGQLFTPKGFRAQAAMIEYCLETRQMQQALTLSREAVVSWLCAHKNGTTDHEVILERERRQEIQAYLNELVARAEKHELADDGPEKQLADFWARLRDVRNHVNHAGMRQEQFKLHRLYKNAEQLAREAEQWIRGTPPANF